MNLIINALEIKDQRLEDLYNDAKAHIKKFDDDELQLLTCITKVGN
ncbi:MAG: hypothetical protein WCS56_05430 [Bacilli bacterium]